MMFCPDLVRITIGINYYIYYKYELVDNQLEYRDIAQFVASKIFINKLIDLNLGKELYIHIY